MAEDKEFIKIDGAKQLMTELLSTTHNLVEESPVRGKTATNFLNILQGVYRKNNIRLQSVSILCNLEAIYSNSALELVRNMIEDVVNLEYMRVAGKEKLAKRFKDYIWVQLHNELELRKSLGLKIKSKDFPEDEALISNNYNKLPSWLKSRVNFSGMKVEEMLIFLSDKKVLPKSELDLIETAYLRGCRKTHLNPFDTISWLKRDLSKEESRTSQTVVIIFGVASYLWLTTRYIDEIREASGKNLYQEALDEVLKIRSKFFGLDRVV